MLRNGRVGEGGDQVTTVSQSHRTAAYPCGFPLIPRTPIASQPPAPDCPIQV